MHTMGSCHFSRTLPDSTKSCGMEMMVPSVRIVTRTSPRKPHRNGVLVVTEAPLALLGVHTHGRRREQHQKLQSASHAVDHAVFKPTEDLLGQIDDFHDNSKPQTGENNGRDALRCICDTLHGDTHGLSRSRQSHRLNHHPSLPISHPPFFNK